MMKKSFLYVLILCFALSTNAFARTADFSWNTGNGGIGEKRRGVSALGIGLITGWPASSVALRYRSPNNHVRLMATFGFDYAPSLAIPGKKSLSRDYTLGIEYVLFGIPVAGRSGGYKLWSLDFAPFISLGLYEPLDDPRSPIDYWAIFAHVGLSISLDLPYSNIPIGLLLRAYYIPTIPFVKDHFIYRNKVGVDVGIVWHIKLSGGEKVTQSSNKKSASSTKQKKSGWKQLFGK